jgi:ATP-binding cassette subfamily B protein
MLGPFFTKLVIDDVIPKKNLGMLWLITAAFIVSIIVMGWCMRYRIKSITIIGQDVLKDMRFDIFQPLIVGLMGRFSFVWSITLIH